MVKVVMLVSTHYSLPRKKGDIVEVPERVASRWVANGIATYADTEQPGAEAAPAANIVNYERDFKAAELQEMAKSRGLEGWDSMKKKELAQALHDLDALQEIRQEEQEQAEE